MMNTADVKQVCIDLSTAAIALFDLIDADGIDAPIDSQDGVAKLVAVVDTVEEIRSYYAGLNIQRIIAMGVAPYELLANYRKELS
jgi:hypothetical protein